MNEFNEYVREVFSPAGDIAIRSMMGGQVGPGTVLYVAGIGIFVNVVYSSLNFDVKRLHHQSIREIIQGGKA